MEQDLLEKILIKVVDIDGRLDTFATKQNLDDAKTEILTMVDRFAKLHETLDHELVSLRSKYERLEERLSLIEQKVGIGG